MGRKYDMKKIEDITKCQVTFSKRRTSLIRKAHEICIYCGVDVALIMFSPSGRISKYSNRDRIEDVIDHYTNLPFGQRVRHINNIERNLKKLRLLGSSSSSTWTWSDSHRLQYLDKQIENLELQIKKRSLELQIIEAGLRDYEILQGQEPSLRQLSWCEKNLNNSLQRIILRKKELHNNFLTSSEQPNIQQPTNSQVFNQTEPERQPTIPFPSHPNQNNLVSIIEVNPTTNDQFLMQLDPWMISPYSDKVGDGMLQELVDQSNLYVDVGGGGDENIGFYNNIGPDIPNSLHVHNVQFPEPTFELTTADEQPLIMVDNPASNFDFLDQIHHNTWNSIISALSSDEVSHLSTLGQCNFNDTRVLTSDENSENVHEEGGQQHSINNRMGRGMGMMGYTSADHLDHNERIILHSSSTSDQSHMILNNDDDVVDLPVAVELIPQDDVLICDQHNHLLLHKEDVEEENRNWIAKVQRASMWEWEDLLLN